MAKKKPDLTALTTLSAHTTTVDEACLEARKLGTEAVVIYDPEKQTYQLDAGTQLLN